jgi:hypothetical protein
VKKAAPKRKKPAVKKAVKKAAPKRKKPVVKMPVKKAAPKVTKPAVKKAVKIAVPKIQAPAVKEDMKATLVEKSRWHVLKSGPHLEVRGTWEFSVKNPNIATLRFLKLK